MEEITARKLAHSGPKRAYPSSFVWDCLKCEKWNIWKTRNLYGKVEVCCQWCESKFILNKSNPKEEITRKRNDGAIID